MAKEGILQFGLPLSAKAGLSVHRMWEGTPDRDHDIYIPHRDTQYLLLLVTGGGFLMGLDFDQVSINAPSVVLICPWQLHHLIQSREPVGLTIDFDATLVEEGLLSAVSTHSGRSRGYRFQPIYNATSSERPSVFCALAAKASKRSLMGWGTSIPFTFPGCLRK